MTVREEPTHQPARAIGGNCPDCGKVVLVFNNHEVWAIVACSCGWRGATNEILNYHRFERVNTHVG